MGNIAPRIGGDTTETTVAVPDTIGLEEALTTLTHADGVWSAHSDAPPGWVSSDDAGLADALGEHYGCAVRPWADV